VIKVLLRGRPELTRDIEALLYTAWATDDSYDPLFPLGPELDPKSAYQLAFSGATAMLARPFAELIALIRGSKSRDENCFFQQVGPGCLIQHVYTSHVFPTLEPVESALDPLSFFRNQKCHREK